MTVSAANTISSAPSSTLNATPMKTDRRLRCECPMYPMLKSAIGTARTERTTRNHADSPSTVYVRANPDA